MYAQPWKQRDVGNRIYISTEIFLGVQLIIEIFNRPAGDCTVMGGCSWIGRFCQSCPIFDLPKIGPLGRGLIKQPGCYVSLQGRVCHKTPAGFLGQAEKDQLCLRLKRRTSPSISVGVFGFSLGKVITVFNTVILHS